MPEVSDEMSTSVYNTLPLYTVTFWTKLYFGNGEIYIYITLSLEM
jgi:hypothetical protein